MAQLYTYYPEFDKDDCLFWHVYENSTEQIIHSCMFEEDAEDMCRFLSNGGAFSGFTPSFMLNKVPVKTDINAAFSAEFA